MALKTLSEKAPNADFLREMIGFAAERLMALEVETLCGAGHSQRRADPGDLGLIKTREAGRIIPVVAIVAVAVNTEWAVSKEIHDSGNPRLSGPS